MTPETPRSIARASAGLMAAVVAATLTAGVEAQRRDRDPAPPRDRPAVAATGALAGRVVTADGLPLERARVTARGRDARHRVTTGTDAQGRYLLADLPAGRYTVTVSKPGFVTLAFGQRRPRQPAIPVTVEAGRTADDVNFSLPAGSVVTGRVVDEDGRPLPLAQVTALGYVYQQGQRQLVTAGADRTDDRGEYRIFGLDPGRYYVRATVRSQETGSGPFGAGGPGARVDADDDGAGYAPTYYPGVTTLAQAAPVTLGLGAEVGGLDFGLPLVRTAAVGGVVVGPDGSTPGGVQVMLIPDDGPMLRGAVLGGRADAAGAFLIGGVPPGRYVLRAATGGGRGRRAAPARSGGPALFARESIVIDGLDVTNLTLRLGPGATVDGTIAFVSTSRPAPDDPTQIRVTATAVETLPMMMSGRVTAPVEPDGTFRLDRIADGRRVVSATNVPDGWVLDAVYLDGRDIIDTPIDFGVGRADGLSLVFADRVTELSGTVHDGRGAPRADYTVIVFPVDEERWQAHSRAIRASRPDQHGAYRLRGLPPGRYLLAVVELVEQGEWLDPAFLGAIRDGAARLTLGAGEMMTLDLTPGQSGR